jgi:hypothetical protein
MIKSANILEQKSRVAARVDQLLSDRQGVLPVWIRPPKNGPEHYTGFGRSKLYELAAAGKITSRSIRDSGQVKGTRLFHLQSILDFIEKCGREPALGGLCNPAHKSRNSEGNGGGA